MRDQIQYENTKYVTGCYSRGRIFMEHIGIYAAQNLMDTFPCLAQDNYQIYTRDEWNHGVALMTQREYDRWEGKGICSQCGCTPCKTPGACASDARRDEGIDPREKSQREDYW